MPRAPLHNYVPASFTIGGCAIFLCLVGLLIFQQGNNAQQILVVIRHTRAVMGDVNDLNILIRDAERGQRGYILTGMPQYLSPYEAAVKQLPPLYDHFRGLLANNPRQRQQLVALSSLIQQELAGLAQAIQLRRDSGEEAARRIMLSGSAPLLMTQITAAIDDVMAEENRQLAERNIAIRETDARMRLLSVAASVAAVLSLALAALLLRRSARRQRTIEQEKDR